MRLLKREIIARFSWTLGSLVGVGGSFRVGRRASNEASVVTGGCYGGSRGSW